ncbi:Gfo/Idh/MocA family protein [Amnibacterium flavum]|uniref:Oxidoreductase n=1 Tax=Amnibacterium flavum TaxID=2173173 RepID=A0A2V1HKR3_9MICO|nr:Gfo/Idh/MocA family oxidoreductase [Amnibacterium flavum]PVZ93228.1 oxidoreductase [Amnibacterium flavum]
MIIEKPLRVGIIGAGPVTQAVHLPTLARLPGLFEVAAVMDVSAESAEAVARRVGARSTTSFEAVLSDDSIDVVAICTPDLLHADQVIAAMEAGKRAVFCEKPLATTLEEADRIAETARRLSVPLVVGAMHVHDPAWQSVQDVVAELAVSAHTVRSSIVLPFNERFQHLVTELLPKPPAAPPAEIDAEVLAGLMELAVLSLAVHDLPLVRAFLPASADVEVAAAELLSPFGYALTVTAGGRMLDLIGLVNAQWHPSWELEVFGDSTRLHLAFTPSFVHAGSAVATVERAGVTSVFGPFASNGYEGEWRLIARILTDPDVRAPSVETLVSDLHLAVDLANQASAKVREAAGA